MSLSNITSEMTSVNEKFNLVSPSVFPSIILLKVEAYSVIACNVNQCASCGRSSAFRWQSWYGSLLEKNVAVSRDSLTGDILLCLQYVILRQKQWVQHSLIYCYNRNLCSCNESFNTSPSGYFNKHSDRNEYINCTVFLHFSICIFMRVACWTVCFWLYINSSCFNAVSHLYYVSQKVPE
jgi:hypothetical protein